MSERVTPVAADREERKAVRTPVSAGNWKMNTTAQEFEALAAELRPALDGIGGVERVVCPPFIHLRRAQEIFEGSGVGLGAQNVHWEDRGAYTGEISAAMLAGLVEYVIIGHSERRRDFGETEESVNKRTAAALRHGLRPIVCVGETLDQRKAGSTGEVLDQQIRGGLVGITLPEGFIVAYEPVWAIGTGRAATGTIANEAIGFIRRQVAAIAGPKAGERVRILYGGSVTAANVEEFMREPEIDGALVGGASLKADEFAAITRAIAEARARGDHPANAEAWGR
jgi:triosephosphate isomerase (TIM)